MDETSEAEQHEAKEEEARQEVKRRYDVVRGLWVEPGAKVFTTSDGRTWVAAWLPVEP